MLALQLYGSTYHPVFLIGLLDLEPVSEEMSWEDLFSAVE